MIWQTIPGETPVDPSGLRDKSIKNRAQLNRVEAENIRKVVTKYFTTRATPKKAPFTLIWCKSLHQSMFEDVWDWAGQTRQRDINIGVAWYLAEQQLQSLLDDLQCWKQNDMPVVEQAARLHHKAVTIHPFPNGNGRWSRLLSNLWLHLHQHRTTAWPEQLLGELSPIREEYLKALQQADNGDLDTFILLHEKYTVA